MRKSEAVDLLGGSQKAVADKCGVSVSAVSAWPEELPPRIADRIEAALWRTHRAEFFELRRAHLACAKASLNSAFARLPHHEPT